MNRKALAVIAVTLLAGLVLGFSVGRMTSSLSKPSAVGRTSTGANLAESGSPSAPPSNDNSVGWGFGNSASVSTKSAEIAPITYEELKAELVRVQSSGWTGLSGLRSMTHVMDRLAVSDLPEISRRLLNEGSASDFSPNLYFVLGAYAENDPEGAWQMVTNLPNGPLKQQAIGAVATGISSKDPKRALQLIDQIDNAQTRSQVRSMALAHLAASDPGEALRLHRESRESGAGNRYDSTVSMIFSQWARSDIQAARTALGDLDGSDRDYATQAVVAWMAQTDAKAAFDLAQSLPPAQETHMDPRIRAIQVWATSDPQAAIDAASTIEFPALRAQAISGALATWSRNDFTGALAYAVNTENTTERSERLNILTPNSSADREQLLSAALDYMPPGESFQRTVSNIFSTWANEDPAAAAQAVFRLPPGRVVNSAVSSVATNLVRQGQTSEALAWARRLPDGETRLSGIESIFEQWATTDARDAIPATANLPEDEQSRALSAIGEGWSQRDPESALQWGLTLSDDGVRRSVVRDAMSELASTSPEQAATMVEQLSDTDRGTAMPVVVSRWASKDAMSAAEWLDRQPQGPGKDGALSNLARTLASEDPETAISMSAQIQDGRSRDRSIYGHARTWLRNEPDTARAWIQSSALLTEEQKTRLLD